MPEYTLINPVTGKRWFVPVDGLTRELRLNCILFRGDEHLGIITHRDLIAFTRWCISKILALLEGEPDQRMVHALALVDRWLEDEKSVTPEELEACRLKTQAASGAAWSATRDPRTHGPASVSFARAVDTIWHAIEAVGNDANAASSASLASVRVTQCPHTPYEAQAQWLVEHLRSGK